jgi:serine/threonine protein kinase
MVTGPRPFRGDSKLSTLSAILKDDPKPASSLTPEVPRDLEKIVDHCLRKDPTRRFQHIDDVKTLLEELKEESESGKRSGVVEAKPNVRRPSRLAWLAGFIVVILIAVVVLWLRFFRSAATSSGLPPKIVRLTSYAGDECCPSFSPDGNQVAFVWNGPKQDNDDIKLIGTENAVRLTSDPARDCNPAWSPDGRQIAFIRVLSETKGAVFLVPA